MVTIQDVAKAAGVSAMTVSYVINEKPNVSLATRRLVRETIVRLDYRVNVAARNLRTGRTGTIGLAVPDIDKPYYGQLAARIVEVARGHGLRVAIEQTGARREHELDVLMTSRNRLYDGLILSTVGLGQADVDLLHVDHPVVLLGERIFEGPVDHVAMPNVEGADAVVSHLIAQGCRRIAMLDSPDNGEINVSSFRFTGYRDALERAGLSFDPALRVFVDEFSMSGGTQGITRLREAGTPFDGVFCITDTVAIGALRGLADAGLSIPSQVKVAGFDNIEESSFSIPRLTTLDPDHDFMARTAVDRLVQRISGSKEAPQDFFGTPTVVTRDSTAA